MPTSSEADDRARKASSPRQLRAQTWAYALRRALHEFVRDGCIDAAAGLTFFSVLAIFPAGVALVALISVFAVGADGLDRLLQMLGAVAPPAVTDTLRTVLTEASPGAPDLAAVVGIAVALWSASIYVSAFGRAVNRIYQVDEGRPYWKRKPAQLALTIALILLVMVVVAVLVLSGPVARSVQELLGSGDEALRAWSIARWPVLAVAVLVLVTLLYKGTGNLRQPGLRWLVVGAGTAIIAMGVASAAFAAYVAAFANYDRTFGALTSVVVFLIWLFLINLSLLLGAEVNSELERARQLQAGMPAEAQLQLSARDTTASDRSHAYATVTEERGTLLREDRTLPPRTDTLVARARRAASAFLRRLRHRD